MLIKTYNVDEYLKSGEYERPDSNEIRKNKNTCIAGSNKKIKDGRKQECINNNFGSKRETDVRNITKNNNIFDNTIHDDTNKLENSNLDGPFL